MKSIKNLIPGLLFVSLLVGGLIWIIYSSQYGSNENNTDQNQNTQNPAQTKYTNSEWGFEITYPKGWYYGQVKGGATTPLGVIFSDDKGFVETGKLSSQQPYPNKWVNFIVYKTDKTVEKYSSDDLLAKNAKLTSRQQIKVSGLNGLEVKSIYNNQTYLSAYLGNGGYIYIFESIITKVENVPEVENIFKAVVSSFKFTHSLSQQNDLLTYSGNGFEFKYPRNFYFNSPESITSYDIGTIVGGGNPPQTEIKMYVQVYPNLTDSLEDWVNQVNLVEYSNTRIDSVPAVRGKIVDKTFGTSRGDVRFIKNGTGYQIGYSPYDSKYLEVFNQLLEDFKFVTVNP